MAQLGLSTSDMKFLTMGQIFDIFGESYIDENGQKRKATQSDFDEF